MTINMLTAAARKWAAARWLPSPAGCCECGTGGPYYRGSGPQVTRYAYRYAYRDDVDIDWTACEAHKVGGRAPAVDYGRDVVVSFRRVGHDLAMAALLVSGRPRHRR